jgi:hypothetical protein
MSCSPEGKLDLVQFSLAISRHHRSVASENCTRAAEISVAGTGSLPKRYLRQFRQRDTLRRFAANDERQGARTHGCGT